MKEREKKTTTAYRNYFNGKFNIFTANKQALIDKYWDEHVPLFTFTNASTQIRGILTPRIVHSFK